MQEAVGFADPIRIPDQSTKRSLLFFGGDGVLLTEAPGCRQGPFVQGKPRDSGCRVCARASRGGRGSDTRPALALLLRPKQCP